MFGERRVAVARLTRDLRLLLREEGTGLDEARKNAAQRALAELKSRFGYEDVSAGDAVTVLVSERFADLLN